MSDLGAELYMRDPQAYLGGVVGMGVNPFHNKGGA
jgi:hypothetical protein